MKCRSVHDVTSIYYREYYYKSILLSLNDASLQLTSKQKSSVAKLSLNICAISSLQRYSWHHLIVYSVEAGNPGMVIFPGIWFFPGTIVHNKVHLKKKPLISQILLLSVGPLKKNIKKNRSLVEWCIFSLFFKLFAWLSKTMCTGTYVLTLYYA